MRLFSCSSSCCIGCALFIREILILLMISDIVTNVQWSWSTMSSAKSLRFSTDVHGRLYAALAADEQRRVVQLSFTGCVNFSDMSDIDVGCCWYLAREMDETAWKWLEWGMETCWKKSTLSGHEQRGFDFRHACVWHDKNLLKPFKVLCQTLWNFSLKMLKRHDFTWNVALFWGGS